MEVTVLGTANPLPQLERHGTAIAVTIGDDRVLVDCGPGTTYGLVEHGIDLTAIEDVFFTHHHPDHNAGFPHFALVSWFFGRRGLTAYGPEGTRDLVRGLASGYRVAIDAWRDHGYAPDTDDGVTEIDVVEPGELDGLDREWRVTASPVRHSLPTVAYRFDEPATGRSFVYSSDTAPVPSLEAFAADADVLLYSANAQGPTEAFRDEGDVPARYFDPPFDAYHRSLVEGATESKVAEIHSTPQQAASVAAAAGVDTLVLTHFNPYRDPEAIAAAAEAAFDGTVIVAEDGTSVTLD